MYTTDTILTVDRIFAWVFPLKQTWKLNFKLPEKHELLWVQIFIPCLFFFSRFLIFISGWGLGTEFVFIFLLCYRFHMCPPLYFFFSNWEWGLWRFTVILAKKLSRWLRKTSKTGWSPVLLKLLELLKLQKKKILLMLNESLKNSGNSKEEQYLKVKFCTLRRVTLGLLISCLWDSNRLQNVF